MNGIEDDIKNAFLKATTREMAAEVLGTTLKRVNYYLFKIPSDERYRIRMIAKKSGRYREISEPVTGLKLIQKRLAEILSIIYEHHPCAHGFIPRKSIVSNALPHVGRCVVVNLDLKNFFPSIHFGRVKGLFMSKPFCFNEEVAIFIAQICCHDGHLPQGAPTSPVISNLICRQLDDNLMCVATKERCIYTRYADDITFSFDHPYIPYNIGIIDEQKMFVPSAVVRNIIQENGFEVNYCKVRWSIRAARQEVTGLIVNDKVNVKRRYVRRIRAILHAWEKYGLEAASKEHFSKYSLKTTSATAVSFTHKVFGMISYVGMVVGKDNPVYLSLREKYDMLMNGSRDN